MDRKTLTDGPKVPASWVGDQFDATADDLHSHARQSLGGCISGLLPNLATEMVSVGEAYFNGDRLRLNAAAAIDVAGVTRPTGTEVAWLAVLASYTTAGTDTVTDREGVTYTLCIDDSIIIALSRGVDAANEAAAVRPAPPEGSIVLCDILLDATSAVADLDTSASRRPLCPDDDLQEQIDQLSRTVNQIAATALLAASSPNKGPTPSATSTSSLVIDATWAAGAVPGGAPAVDGYRFRWRQAGENWSTGRTVTLTDVLETSFTVPDGDSDVLMQVAAGNTNGYGAWSDDGTIDSGDIVTDPPLRTLRFDSTGDHSGTWEWRRATRARVTVRAGAGGDGTDGAMGADGAEAVATGPWRTWSVRCSDTNDQYSYVSFENVILASEPGVFPSCTAEGFTYQVATNVSAPYTLWDDGSSGAQGTPGTPGSAGVNSTLDIPARSVDRTATGGAGGAGGDGGAGGAGGSGPNGQGVAGGAGGEGEDGSDGQNLVFDVTGLNFGDAFSLTVGAGGAGSPGGADGLVTIVPMA